jgi:hypothetical protein
MRPEGAEADFLSHSGRVRTMMNPASPSTAAASVLSFGSIIVPTSTQRIGVVCFFATHIDNLSNTATSVDEQKFSHEKDDPDRISATNLCVNSERLWSAIGPRLRPPRRGKECQKISDF